MYYEKLIKDERGKIRITVTLRIDQWHGNEFNYNTRVTVIPPKKRNEIWDSSIATEAEILEAKTEFWNLIKPQ